LILEVLEDELEQWACPSETIITHKIITLGRRATGLPPVGATH